MSQSQSHRQLSLPTGTETLQLDEAARHRRITRTLEDCFLQWGYRPAETPLVDYFEVYRRLLSEDGIATMYRAVDRHGDILAVRSDTTLFLAKQLGLHLDSDDLPVRVFYNDQIVRAEDRHDLSNNEYQQAGIELVGIPGAEGDIEVLLLATEALSALKLETVVVHIGSREVVEALITEHDLPREALLHALINRDRHALRELSVPDAAISLLLFVGTPSELHDALTSSASMGGRAHAAANELAGLIETVVSLSDAPDTWRQRLRIDLSEVGSHRFYTGIAFSAYAAEVNDAVLRGGRYDTLLRDFGFDVPSVGFSMYTRKLPLATCRDETHTPSRAVGATLAERVTHARTLHQTGEMAHL